MAGSVCCTVKQRPSAKPTAVYDVFMDVERWPEWMPTVSTASWERRGAPGTGVGGVRRVRARLTQSRDNVIGGMRPHHHAYTAALSAFAAQGFPRRHPHRGTPQRVPDHLYGDMHITYPGLAKSVHKKLESVYTRLAAALAQEAERVESSKDR